MSKETKAPVWGDFFVNRVVWGLIIMVVLWITITCFGPACMLWSMGNSNMAAYGQVGDMFGMVNSLFSGLAFLAAIYAVILQTIEMREAGERRLEEEKQQTDQMRIAKDTAFLQSLMLRETRRNTMNQILSEVTETSHVLYKEILIYHRRQILAKQTGGGIEHEQLRAALADLLMVNAKVAGLRTSIITTFSTAGEDLVISLHGWIDLVEAIAKRDETGNPTVNVMQDAELEAKLQGKLNDTLNGIGKVFESETYLGRHYIYSPDEPSES